MRVAHITNGIVTNISRQSSNWAPPLDGSAIASDTANIGDTYSEGSFTAPVVTWTKEQLKSYANTIQDSKLAAIWTFNVAPSGDPHEITTRLDDKGSIAMMKIMLWTQLNAAVDPPPTLPYSNVDSSPTVLTLQEAQNLVLQAGNANQAAFSALNALITAIENDVVTTQAEIDAWNWTP